MGTLSFTDLPAEIRLMIYCFYFSTVEHGALNMNITAGSQSANAYKAKTSLALLRVNKAISSEAQEVMYGDCNFHFKCDHMWSCTCAHRYNRIPVEALAKFSNLTMEIGHQSRMDYLMKNLIKSEKTIRQEFAKPAHKSLTLLATFVIPETYERTQWCEDLHILRKVVASSMFTEVSTRLRIGKGPRAYIEVDKSRNVVLRAMGGEWATAAQCKDIKTILEGIQYFKSTFFKNVSIDEPGDKYRTQKHDLHAKLREGTKVIQRSRPGGFRRWYGFW